MVLITLKRECINISNSVFFQYCSFGDSTTKSIYWKSIIFRAKLRNCSQTQQLACVFSTPRLLVFFQSSAGSLLLAEKISQRYVKCVTPQEMIHQGKREMCVSEDAGPVSVLLRGKLALRESRTRAAEWEGGHAPLQLANATLFYTRVNRPQVEGWNKEIYLQFYELLGEHDSNGQITRWHLINWG